MQNLRIFRPLAWLALAAIIFVTVSPIALRPADALPVSVDRALAFAVMAFLFAAAYPRQIWLLAGLMILSAGAIELLQFLSPTRHPQWHDAIVKAGGAIIGLLAARLMRGSLSGAWSRKDAGGVERS